MFKNFLKKKTSTNVPENVKNDKEVIEKIYSTLKECLNSEGFCVFTSNTYKKEDGNVMIRHNFFQVRFNDNDLPIALKQYSELVETHRQKIQQEEQLQEVQNKIPGANPAPVEKPAEADFKPVEEFKVEEN